MDLELNFENTSQRLKYKGPCRRAAENNKLASNDRPVHDWYRFVLSFPPHLVSDYLGRFAVRPGDVVLDPFCGTGTTIVECKKRGLNYVGIEANPVAHFAAQTKTNWTPDPAELLDHSRAIATQAERCIADSGVCSDPILLFEKPSDRALLTLSDELSQLLLTNSISPLPLHKVIILKSCIERCRDPRYYDHERLALAKAIVSPISNLQFGPEVGVGPLKGDASVVSSWMDNIRAISSDLQATKGFSASTGSVIAADARNVADVLAPRSVDAVITSPPYPNEKDYTRTTRLESVLLDFIRTKAELQTLKRGLLKSNTRGVYKTDTDDGWAADYPEIQAISAKIEARRIELGKTSGFERLYARVTRLYFGGMARHLADLRAVLKPGARLAYVVGDQASYLRVLIRTGQLIAGIACSLGYEVISIDLFRTRLATATKEQLREEVVVFRWPGGHY